MSRDNLTRECTNWEDPDRRREVSAPRAVATPPGGQSAATANPGESARRRAIRTISLDIAGERLFAATRGDLIRHAAEIAAPKHISRLWSRPSFGRRECGLGLEKCPGFAGLRQFGGLDEPVALAPREARATSTSGAVRWARSERRPANGPRAVRDQRASPPHDCCRGVAATLRRGMGGRPLRRSRRSGYCLHGPSGSRALRPGDGQSASQLAGFFLLGCTRGGSPGIFG